MKKKLAICLILIMASVLNACGGSEEEIIYRKDNGEKKEVVVEETTVEIKNLKNHATKTYKYVEPEEIDEEDFLDKKTKFKVKKQKVSYDVLIDYLNHQLEVPSNEFKYNDKLVFNYKINSENGSIGIQETINREGKKDAEEFYENTEYYENDNTYRLVISVKKDEEEKIQSATFATREMDKEVKLEYEETNNKDLVVLLTENKVFKIGKIYGLKEFIDEKNYSGKGEMTLAELRDFVDIGDTGLEIIESKEVEVAQEDEEGKRSTRRYDPSQIKFKYDIEVKEGKITLKMNMLNAMKEYCKYRTDYGVLKATYEISIEKNEIEEKVNEIVGEETEETDEVAD